MEPACLSLKLLFPSLGHRLKKEKKPHLVCPSEQGGPGLGADGTTDLEFAIMWHQGNFSVLSTVPRNWDSALN